MGGSNTHMADRAREEADSYASKWSGAEQFRWSYTKDKGPDSWWVFYPACSGMNQSPVDIDTETTDFDPNLANNPLKIRYFTDGTYTAKNTGHSCQVDVRDCSSFITGGPLKGKFPLYQFHFHWGAKDDCGSEHTVNGKSYAGELHMVHWDSVNYNSAREAAEQEGGLAFTAIFLKVGKANSQLATVTDIIPEKLKFRGQFVELDSFDVSKLLPADTTKYWVYNGSLTTPPCYESVTWIIFYEPIEVSSQQLAIFRNMLSYSITEKKPFDEFGGCIMANCRHTMSLNMRRIMTNEHLYIEKEDFHEQFDYEAQNLFASTMDYTSTYNRQGND